MNRAASVKPDQLGGAAESGGVPARCVGRWLSLAAAPTFAIMALATALWGTGQDVPGMPMRGSSAMSPMALMYLLMGIFHAPAWLKLTVGRRRGARHRGSPFQ